MQVRQALKYHSFRPTMAKAKTKTIRKSKTKTKTEAKTRDDKTTWSLRYNEMRF